MGGSDGAKTCPPRLHAAYPRERIFKALDRYLQNPLVWVAGPPGAGKTTLLASYLASRKLRFLWYRVDRTDGDPALLFRHLRRAVNASSAGRNVELPLPTAADRVDLESFGRRYFRALHAQLPKPTTLVLDDFQEAPAPSRLGGILCEAFREVPSGLGAVIAGRGLPPPDLARCGGAQVIPVLGWDELRLTPDETREIACRDRDVTSVAAVSGLHDCTDGWVSGLMLLKEHISELPGREQEFRYRHALAPVFDYLAAESFNRLPAESRKLLTMTAALPDFTEAEAEALSGNPDAGRLLDELFRHQCFIDRLEGRPVRYRYHALFREFLLGGLPEAGAGRGGTVPARIRGRSMTPGGPAGGIPQEAIGAFPWLLFWAAACRKFKNPGEARDLFTRAFGLFETADDPVGLYSAWAEISDTFTLELDDFHGLDRWIEALDRLMARHPEFPNVELEARVTCGMVQSLLLRQPHRCRDIARRVERLQGLLLTGVDCPRRIQLGGSLLHYYLWFGFHTRATELVERLRECGRCLGFPAFSPVTRLTLESGYAGAVSRARAKRRREHSRSTHAAEHAEGVPFEDFAVQARAMDGNPSREDLEAGEQFLARGKCLGTYARRFEGSHHRHVAAWDAIHAGHHQEAVENAEQGLALAAQAGVPYLEAQHHAALAWIHFCAAKDRPAVRHLARARRLARAMGNGALEFECTVIRAWMALEGGRAGRGVKLLRRVFAPDVREHAFQLALRAPPDVMCGLCIGALEAGVEPEFVRMLVRECGLVPASPPVHLEDWPWPVRIHTLGQFELMVGDQPVQALGKVPKKPMELLKCLIAFGGRGVPIGKIDHALWQDTEGDAAHDAFNVALHRLRRILGHKQALVLAEGCLSLDPRYWWVDTWAFERLMGEADAAPEFRAAGGAETARRALSLYRGEFLAGEAEAPWSATLRERLRSKFVRLVCRLGWELESEGRLEEAIERYRRGIETDDVAESFYLGLMRCCHRLGRRAEGLAVYRDLRRVLSLKLGMPPGPESEALRQRLEQDQ